MFSQLVSLIEKVDDDQPSPAPVAPPPPRERNASDAVSIPIDDAVEGRAEETHHSSDVALANGDGSASVTEILEATLGDVPPSPIPVRGLQSQVLSATEADQVAALVANLATVEGDRDSLRRQLAFAQRNLEAMKQKLEAFEEIVRRLAGADGETPSADDEGKCEAKALLEDSRDQAIQYLQQLTRHHVATIDELTHELEATRARRIQLELFNETNSKKCQEYEKELTHLRADLETTHASAAAAKKENARLSARAEALRRSIETLEVDTKRQRAELDAAAAQIMRRDTEIAFMRQMSNGPVSRELRAEPIMNAIAKNKVGSKVVSAATMLDSIVVRLGRLLRGNAQLRLVAALYIVVLHVYVFNAIMMLLHHSSIMPDHTGSDVHDHIANHVHH